MNILLVDDEPVTLMFLRRVCGGPGRTLLEAGTFHAAHWTAAENMLNLVITDLQLPDQNGYAVANMIQQYHPNCPMFMVTGSDDDVDLRFAAMAGFARIFHKPLNAARIAESVSAVEKGRPLTSMLPARDD